MKKLLATERVEIGAAITDGCKAIHGKSSNEFIALIDRQPPKQKRVRVKIVGLDTIRDDLESVTPVSRPIWNRRLPYSPYLAKTDFESLILIRKCQSKFA